MRPGTPSFVGVRLREVREARGLTQGALGEMLGVSNRAVSQYEGGKVSPHPDVAVKLPGVLNVPMAFFLDPVRASEPEGTVFWRSMSAATGAARARAERRFDWFKRLVDFLGGYVRFPAVGFPDWDFPSDLTAIGDGDVEAAAVRLRAHWKLGSGPISNVVYLLENNGAAVGRITLAADTLDAFSQWRQREDRPYVVLGADKGSAARSRWDAAHELGHMIVHRRVPPGVLRHTTEFQRMELQAHDFAGAFLLPAETFADDFVVPTLDSLQALKLKWNVSMSAMLMRARKLRLISREQEQRFWRSYAKKGYKRGEPFDDRVPPEQPVLGRQSIVLLLDQRIVSRDQLRAALPYSAGDIEELAALPPGFLGDDPQVHLLARRDANVPRRPAPTGDPTILQFPGVRRG